MKTEQEIREAIEVCIAGAKDDAKLGKETRAMMMLISADVLEWVVSNKPSTFGAMILASRGIVN